MTPVPILTSASMATTDVLPTGVIGEAPPIQPPPGWTVQVTAVPPGGSASCFALFGASDTCLSFAPVGKLTGLAIVAVIGLLFFMRK